jgi:DNA adenine methylase
MILTDNTSNVRLHDTNNNVEAKKLSPILKWTGGKETELKYIMPNLPASFRHYYEPFVGGGAVYTAIQANNYYINDKSEELITLYRSLINHDSPTFFKITEGVIQSWDLLSVMAEQNASFFISTFKNYIADTINTAQVKDVFSDFVNQHKAQFVEMVASIYDQNTSNFLKELKINLLRKSKRMKELESLKEGLDDAGIVQNLETALKSAFYMHIRHLYNHANTYNLPSALQSALFFFIRNFAYSGMFRYNAQGDFNVPYGGIGYNRKNLLKKVDYLRSPELTAHLKNTVIENMDFEDFFNAHSPTPEDFIFLDPPYDSEFSTYAQNEFTQHDQTRLADYLINRCQAKWMMVIKNTDFIYNIYDNKGLHINSFHKSYLVSFMNRNDKNVEHLMITNYEK